MNRRITEFGSAIAAALLALAGCAAHPRAAAPAPTIQPVPTSGSGNIIALQLGPQSPGGPRDPQPKVPLVYRLEAYVISVPFGTVSRNETFWKRINEQCVDVATYDVLYKNGLRIGEAPYQEWEYIRGLIAQHPGTASKMATIGGDAKNVELEMKKDVPFQTLSYFDNENQLSSRDYDRCDNIMTVSFQPAPRKPGELRLALAPMVRVARKRLAFSVLNDEIGEIEYKSPEMFYMNIIVDIPLDSFLILAPSSEAVWPTTIGHKFFTKDLPAEQLEQVIVVTARPFRTDEPN